jgi:hypothetical protein
LQIEAAPASTGFPGQNAICSAKPRRALINARMLCTSRRYSVHRMVAGYAAAPELPREMQEFFPVERLCSRWLEDEIE